MLEIARIAEGPAATLPDLLDDALDVVFVGINPSLFSTLRGHYFARGSNRFWPCFSRSSLSRRARETLGVQRLGPLHDALMPQFGIGFTDVVKRPTVRAADLGSAEMRAGVAVLIAKLERFAPRIACFHGVTGYRYVQRLLGAPDASVALGLQAVQIGTTRLFLAPNPSGANAHYTAADQVATYDRLAGCLNAFPG